MLVQENLLIPYRKGHKWGFCYPDKTIIIPIVFDSVNFFVNGKAVVQRNGKYGFIDLTGNETIPCIYDHITVFCNQAIAKLNRKEKLISTNRESICSRDYDKITMWSGGIHHDYGFLTIGLIEVINNNRSGFINQSGNEVISCQFDKVEYLGNIDLIGVNKHNKWGFINLKGEKKSEFEYLEICHSFDGAIKVRKETGYGFLNKDGIEAIPCVFEKSIVCTEGIIPVSHMGKHGYVTINGDKLTELLYEGAEVFQGGVAIVKKNGKFGFVNKNGFEITSFIYDTRVIGYMSDDMAMVIRNDKAGFIDKSGFESIPCIYENADGFSNGIARVELNRKYGFIDKRGNIIIPCLYDNFNTYHRKDLICLNKNGKYGLSDINGTEILPIEFDEVRLDDEYVRLKQDGKVGFYNSNNVLIVPCIYDDIRFLKNGLFGVKQRNKWTFIKKNTSISSDLFFDDIGYPQYEEGIKVIKNSKVGWVNYNGELFIQCKYNDMSIIDRGLKEFLPKEKLNVLAAVWDENKSVNYNKAKLVGYISMKGVEYWED